ncbi:hypothetical protein SAMN05216456_1324 [Devosia crocina]|uniref:Uncharacterized protein n=1 Tax=Devosia crocina TaxID=429728 RepID=A0A1I7N9L1_9HYPH|nr:hypothetical protein [Devosia crocina]SFV31384.1 hypothetical protein SAMN05216456_1324 [Devosia crocina]
MSHFRDARLVEDLELLVGSRARGKSRAAVRIEDIEALLQVPRNLRSKKAAGATVDPAEFNALVDDLTALYDIMRSLADALQGRVRP